MIRTLARYLAYDAAAGRVRTWVSRVRTLENGVTVVEDLSGWED